MCVCLCVREREREEEGGGGLHSMYTADTQASVYMCTDCLKKNEKVNLRRYVFCELLVCARIVKNKIYNYDICM